MSLLLAVGTRAGAMDDANKREFRKFDPSTIQTDKIVVLTGKRNMGKSKLMIDIMIHLMQHFDGGFAMTNTHDTARELAQFVPDCSVHTEGLDIPVLENIVDVAKSLTESEDPEDHKFRIFGILDDVMSDKKAIKSDVLGDIFKNGRHYNIFLILLVQYMIDLPRNSRTQIDYLFVLKTNDAKVKKNLFEEYFNPYFDDLQEFDSVLTQLTDGFGCMVLDGTQRSNKTEDVIFWYQAETSHPPFMLGNRDFWKMHHQFHKVSKPRRMDDHPIPALAGIDIKAKIKAATTQEEYDDAVRGKSLAPARKNATGAAAVAGTKRKRANKAVHVCVQKTDKDGKIIIPLPPMTPAPPRP